MAQQAKLKFGILATDATVGAFIVQDLYFTPGAVTTVPVEIAEKIDPDNSPVRLFDSQKDARAALGLGS